MTGAPCLLALVKLLGRKNDKLDNSRKKPCTNPWLETLERKAAWAKTLPAAAAGTEGKTGEDLVREGRRANSPGTVSTGTAPPGPPNSRTLGAANQWAVGRQLLGGG